MPFNSNDNSYGPDRSKVKEESFQVLRNSYNIAKEGFTAIPQQELQFRPIASVQQYILPANVHSSVSNYNADELRYINHEQEKKAVRKAPVKEELSGEGIGRVFNKAKKSTKKAVKSTKKTATKSGKAFKKSAVDPDGLVHQGIVAFNDVAIPLAGESIGAAIGTSTGNPVLGAAVGEMAGNLARSQLKTRTGYGSKAKVGIGKYEQNIKLDKVIDKYVRQAKPRAGETYKEHPSDTPYTPLPQVHKRPKPLPRSGGATKAKSAGGSATRAQIVKKIMQEKKLNLPQASKYVKENNLYKK
jgi:hypothetical protein